MQRGSRAVYGREVLHTLQFSRACTIQSVRCNDKKREREREEEDTNKDRTNDIEEETVKMDKKTKRNMPVIVIYAVELSKMQTHFSTHEQRLVYHRPSSCLLFSFSFRSFVLSGHRRRQC